MKIWSEAELKYFKKNYPHKDNRSLSHELNRSIDAIIHKQQQFHLLKQYDWKTNKPNLTPSPSLSYIIGVMFGDGSPNMIKRKTGRTNYNIDLYVLDRDFANAFNEGLYQVLGRRYSMKCYDGRYQVRGQSKVLYLLLKDRDLNSLKRFIEPFPADFIRGFADSEASVCIYSNNGYRGTRLALACTNQEVIEYTGQLLDSFAIRSHISYRKPTGRVAVKSDGTIIKSKKPLYQLSIYDKPSLTKYASEIAFTISRKQNKLMELVQNECNQQDREVYKGAGEGATETSSLPHR